MRRMQRGHHWWPPPPPNVLDGPTITGTAQVDEVLTCDVGRWSRMFPSAAATSRRSRINGAAMVPTSAARLPTPTPAPRQMLITSCAAW